MENNYILYVGMDASKGKADAAILKVCDRRSVKPKFLRKKLSFKFVKSEVTSFLDTVRSYSDDNCTSICFALEVTGIYSTNVYNFIKANLNDNESIRFLNTDFVNQWRKAHNIAKSDPLDAQTISTIIGTDSDVQYVNDNVFENKNGYQDLKALIHRHYQIKKIYSQEINRLIAQCDCLFPELQYVFEPKSAAFIAVLSSYPTTHDIINASKFEVFNVVYEATKHRCSMDKIDKLFDLCRDTLVPDDISSYGRNIILDLVENIKNIKGQLKAIQRYIEDVVSLNPAYKLLLTMTGCGPITAATVIAEFARRHNPVLKHQFERIKNGNKKRHKLANIAIANKIARYIYSIMKNKSSFVILHEHIMRLPEETRDTFFNSISLDFPKNTRKQIYQYSDINGEVHKFVYIKSEDTMIV